MCRLTALVAAIADLLLAAQDTSLNARGRGCFSLTVKQGAALEWTSWNVVLAQMDAGAWSCGFTHCVTGLLNAIHLLASTGVNFLFKLFWKYYFLRVTVKLALMMTH